MRAMHSLIPPPLFRAFLGAVAIVAALGSAPQARAAVLEVAPVRLLFAPTQRGQELQLSNTGPDTIETQVRIMRWTQDNGQDHLAPAPQGEIVASPPMMRIAPGHRQTVRVIRLHPAAPFSELSYRLLIDELPQRNLPHGTGIAVLMRYSIPIFVSAAGAQATAGHRGTAPLRADLSQVHAQVVAGPDGKAGLRIDNDGPHAVRISALSVGAPGGQPQYIDSGLVGYVLAGRQMTWPLNLPYPLSPGLALKARFDDDTEARAVPLDGTGR